MADVADDRPTVLAPAQQAIWLLTLTRPAGRSFLWATWRSRPGTTADPAEVGPRLAALAECHDALRVRVDMTAEGPRQIALPTPSAHDIAVGHDAAALDHPLHAIEATTAAMRADPGGYLWRYGVIADDAGAAALEYVVVDHVISDMTTLDLLVAEFQRDPGELAASARHSYRAYAEAEAGRLDAAALDRHAEFWRPRLEACPVPPRAGRPGERVRAVRRTHAVPGRVVQSLGASRRSGFTPFMLLATAWMLVVTEYLGIEAMTLLAPFANRPTRAQRRMLGCFANIVPINCHADPAASVHATVRRMRESILASLDHQEAPLHEVSVRVPPLLGSMVEDLLVWIGWNDLAGAERAVGGDTQEFTLADTDEPAPFDFDFAITCWDGPAPRLTFEATTRVGTPSELSVLPARVMSTVEALAESLADDPDETVASLRRRVEARLQS